MVGEEFSDEFYIGPDGKQEYFVDCDNKRQPMRQIDQTVRQMMHIADTNETGYFKFENFKQIIKSDE